VIHRLKITEAELVLFHQGALPLREILPLLREDFPLAHLDDREHIAERQSGISASLSSNER
jgi:hypothetical protein